MLTKLDCEIYKCLGCLLTKYVILSISRGFMLYFLIYIDVYAKASERNGMTSTCHVVK